MGKTVEVDFSGLEELSKKIDKAVKKDASKFTQDMAYEVAELFLVEVKSNTPVETGKLRDAWRVGKVSGASDSFVMDVFNDMDYASHVEYGHMQKVGMFVPVIGKTLVKGWVFGKYMMQKAIDSTQRKIGAVIQPKLDGFVKEIFDE